MEESVVKNILVIGSINVDYVIGTARLPKLGETIVGSNFSMNFGGKGANQASALAKQGCCVKMLGAVGKDLSGELAVKNLASFGIDCSDVIRVDAPTGAAVITVCSGDNHIILDIGANAYVTPSLIAEKESLFDWAEAVVLQLEIPTESVIAAAKTARAHGKTVILNPAPVKEIDAEIYRYVDYLIPNEFEAQLITGIEQNTDEDAARAIEALRAMGCREAIVTLGKRGCAYSDGDVVSYNGIYPVTAVDTTAAGDSFIGGICARMDGVRPMKEVLAYAAAVSAITVSRPGASVSIPTADEVAAFLATHAMVRE